MTEPVFKLDCMKTTDQHQRVMTEGSDLVKKIRNHLTAYPPHSIREYVYSAKK